MKKTTLIALVTAALAGTASADTFFVDQLTTGKNSFVLLNFNGGGFNLIQAGAFDTKLNGGPTMESYCVDLVNQPRYDSTYNVNVLPGTALSNGARASYLYQNFAPTITIANYGTAVELAEAGAALQIAIWDVVYDNGNGFGAGNVQVLPSGNILTKANGLLTASIGQTGTASYFQSIVDQQGKAQDMIGAAPVPEPATMAVLGIGALALLRRRRAAK